MERSTMIMIGLIVVSILALGILAVVYYVRNKNTSTVSNKSVKSEIVPEKTKTNNPKVATFEEIQDYTDPFPEPPQEEPPQEPSAIAEEIIDEDEEPYPHPETHYAAQNTNMQPQDYENSYYQEPKKNPYASMGVDYGADDMNFQFTKRETSEEY